MTFDVERAAIRQILQTALTTSLDGIDNPSRDAIENWDSLTHLEIVFMLEDTFDLRFSEQEIVAMRSADEIMSIVAAKHEA